MAIDTMSNLIDELKVLEEEKAYLKHVYETSLVRLLQADNQRKIEIKLREIQNERKNFDLYFKNVQDEYICDIGYYRLMCRLDWMDIAALVVGDRDAGDEVRDDFEAFIAETTKSMNQSNSENKDKAEDD